MEVECLKSMARSNNYIRNVGRLIQVWKTGYLGDSHSIMIQ